MKQIAYILGIIIVVLALLIGLKNVRFGGPSQEALDTFAQCIASKELTMYGAAWCSHCKSEKAKFGSSFKYVPYVECPENQKLCMDKGVTGYPTWIAKDGTKYSGEQGLEKLSQISECPLPKEE